MARASDQDDAAALSAVVVREADRLERIVGEFLSLSRERPPQQEVVAPGPVIDEVIEMLSRRSDLPPGLRIDSTVEEGAPAIWVDADQFRQVLINLMVNAVESFGVDQDRPPQIEVSAAVAGDRLQIRIADNGCGITAERLGQVFTPFHSSKRRGSGLGLAMVERIVREHGGSVRIESGAEAGTTVWTTFPLAGRRLHQGGDEHAAAP